MNSHESIHKITAGIEGLDAILGGGFPSRQFILIQGGPGTGKTTLSLQFLLEGMRRGEKCIYLSLLYGRRDIERIARSHGWDIKEMVIENLIASDDFARLARKQTVFHPVHVELEETIEKIRNLVEHTAPDRLVFDSITELKILSDTSFSYRQQVAGLKRLLSEKCTALFTIGESPGAHVEEFEYIMEGLIQLRQYAPGYGRVRRVLEVTKMRGMDFKTGMHDFKIGTGGLKVYPRLQAFREPFSGRETAAGFTGEFRGGICSGVSELDALTGGGFMAGTTTLIQGASGAGKSSLITLYVHAAARQGQKSSILIFDESVQNFLIRARSIGLDLAPFIREGLVDIRRLHVGEVSPGEFSQIVQSAMASGGIRILVIDSLSGYASAVADQGLVLAQLHELLAHTGDQGVLTFLTVAEQGLIGTLTPDPSSTTILSDAVLLIRFFETQGSIRRAVSIFKKRYGGHENTIREMRITSEGIRFGNPLARFSGVLTGAPSFGGAQAELIEKGE